MQSLRRRNTYTPYRAPLAVSSVVWWLNRPDGVGPVLPDLKTLLNSPKRPLLGNRRCTFC
jgi:hypothetical protein